MCFSQRVSTSKLSLWTINPKLRPSREKQPKEDTDSKSHKGAMELTQDLIADNNNKLRKMKIATLVLIGTLFASSMAMSLTSKSDQFEEFMPQEDFKSWAIDFGHGFVDGVTFNFTANGTAP